MIAVTGATGKLGRLVIAGLLEKFPASEIVAAVRTPDKAADLAALGVQVREADYDKPDTLASALAGADKVLLISGSDIGGDRVKQHQTVIDAAKNAGIKLLAYTSMLRADTSPLKLADVHKKTEQNIQAAGLSFVFLRNGWYFENQTAALGPALEHGVILGTAGDGRFASAAIADYAAAAVAVLTQPNQENKIYELAGDTSYTLAEMAAEVSKQSGKPVAYNNLPPEDYHNALVGFGIPAFMAEYLVDAEVGAAKGELDDKSHTLSVLIGRSTGTLAEAVAAALNG
jgi:NAD(P)H dehydrogenase (quinone)